jgi:hypothetical protein
MSPVSRSVGDRFVGDTGCIFAVQQQKKKQTLSKSVEKKSKLRNQQREKSKLYLQSKSVEARIRPHIRLRVPIPHTQNTEGSKILLQGEKFVFTRQGY